MDKKGASRRLGTFRCVPVGTQLSDQSQAPKLFSTLSGSTCPSDFSRPQNHWQAEVILALHSLVNRKQLGEFLCSPQFTQSDREKVGLQWNHSTLGTRRIPADFCH